MAETGTTWTFAGAVRAITGDEADLRPLSRAAWLVFDPAAAGGPPSAHEVGYQAQGRQYFGAAVDRAAISAWESAADAVVPVAEGLAAGDRGAMRRSSVEALQSLLADLDAFLDRTGLSWSREQNALDAGAIEGTAVMVLRDRLRNSADALRRWSEGVRTGGGVMLPAAAQDAANSLGRTGSGLAGAWADTLRAGLRDAIRGAVTDELNAILSHLVAGGIVAGTPAYALAQGDPAGQPGATQLDLDAFRTASDARIRAVLASYPRGDLQVPATWEAMNQAITATVTPSLDALDAAATDLIPGLQVAYERLSGGLAVPITGPPARPAAPGEGAPAGGDPALAAPQPAGAGPAADPFAADPTTGDPAAGGAASEDPAAGGAASEDLVAAAPAAGPVGADPAAGGPPLAGPPIEVVAAADGPALDPGSGPAAGVGDDPVGAAGAGAAGGAAGAGIAPLVGPLAAAPAGPLQRAAGTVNEAVVEPSPELAGLPPQLDATGQLPGPPQDPPSAGGFAPSVPLLAPVPSAAGPGRTGVAPGDPPAQGTDVTGGPGAGGTAANGWEDEPDPVVTPVDGRAVGVRIAASPPAAAGPPSVAHSAIPHPPTDPAAASHAHVHVTTNDAVPARHGDPANPADGAGTDGLLRQRGYLGSGVWPAGHYGPYPTQVAGSPVAVAEGAVPFAPPLAGFGGAGAMPVPGRGDPSAWGLWAHPGAWGARPPPEEDGPNTFPSTAWVVPGDGGAS